MRKEETILRLSVGIDISKATFDASIISLTEQFEQRVIGNKKFENCVVGFEKFSNWIKERVPIGTKCSFVMEATGVYYEKLAYYLYGEGETVHVVLPNKSKKYAESLDIKSKTDKLDAQMLGRMGVERTLWAWEPYSKLFRDLRCYTREREDMIHECTMLKNQLHAMKHAHNAPEDVLKRYQARIDYLEGQIEQVEKDIKRIIESDKELRKKVKKTLSIPGIGLMTLSVILAETNGFAAIENLKQLSSYVGYDVKIRESGKWKGQARISKRGNSHIRAAMYFPAWTAIKHNQDYNGYYQRIQERTAKPMKGNTAIQRKLLGLVYTIWKNDTEFDQSYGKKVSEQSSAPSPALP